MMEDSGPFNIELFADGHSVTIGKMACSLMLSHKAKGDIVVGLTPMHLVVNEHWLQMVFNEMKENMHKSCTHCHRDGVIQPPSHIDPSRLSYPSHLKDYLFGKRFTKSQRVEGVRWYLDMLNKLLGDKVLVEVPKIECKLFTRSEDWSTFELKGKSFLFGLPYCTIDTMTCHDDNWPFDAVLIELASPSGGVLTEDSKKSLQLQKIGYPAPTLYQITEKIEFSAEMVKSGPVDPRDREGCWVVKGHWARPIELTSETTTRYKHAVREQLENGEQGEYMQLAIQHNCTLTRVGDSGYGIFIVDSLATPEDHGKVSIVAMLTHVLGTEQGVNQHDLSWCQPIGRIINQFRHIYNKEIRDLDVFRGQEPTQPHPEGNQS